MKPQPPPKSTIMRHRRLSLPTVVPNPPPPPLTPPPLRQTRQRGRKPQIRHRRQTAPAPATTTTAGAYGIPEPIADGCTFTDGGDRCRLSQADRSVDGARRLHAAHELPQEVGDYTLLQAGFALPRIFFNFLSALVALLGTVLALVVGGGTLFMGTATRDHRGVHRGVYYTPARQWQRCRRSRRRRLRRKEVVNYATTCCKSRLCVGVGASSYTPRGYT